VYRRSGIPGEDRPWSISHVMRATPEVKALLVAALMDVSHEVRAASAQVLRSCGWTPGNDREAATFAVASGDYAQAVKLGTDALEALLVASESTTDYIREFIRYAKLPDGGTGPIPDEALDFFWERRKPDHWVQQHRDESLLKASDNALYARYAAIEALGEVGDICAMPALCRNRFGPIYTFINVYGRNYIRFKALRSVCFISVCKLRPMNRADASLITKTLGAMNEFPHQKPGFSVAAEHILASTVAQDNVVAYFQETGDANAGELVASFGCDKAIDAVIAFLRRSPSLKIAISLMKQPEAVNRPDARAAAAASLDAIFKLLNTTECPATFKEAVTAAACIGGPKAERGLLALMRSESCSYRRAHISEAMTNIPLTSLDPATRVSLAIARRQFEAAAAEGEIALEPLVEYVSSGQAIPEDRIGAAIRQIDSPHAVSRAVDMLLAKMKQHSHPDRAMKYIRVLAALKDSRAVQPLIRYDQDHFRGDQLRPIISLLGEIGSPEAAPYLLGLIRKDPNHYSAKGPLDFGLQLDAMRALGRIGCKDASVIEALRRKASWSETSTERTVSVNRVASAALKELEGSP
jgi:HEAT repeat protein